MTEKNETPLHPDGLKFVEDTLRGYDEWRRRKQAAANSTDNVLSVSQYIDELALQQQAAAYAQIYNLAGDVTYTNEMLGENIRELFGLTS